MLTEPDKTTARLLGEKWNVSPDIHPDDYLFRFLYELPKFASKEAAIEYYFNDGRNSASQVSAILKDVCKYDLQQTMSLLDRHSAWRPFRHTGILVPGLAANRRISASVNTA